MSAKQCQCCGGTGWEGSDCAEHRWIPVEERLPYPGEDVFVCDTKNGWHGIAFYRDFDKTWDGFQATHWMPLPPMPEHIDDATEEV